MFKKILFLLLVFYSLSFSAVVSERQEVAVFPVFSSYELPSGAAMYFDNQLIGILSGMKRFEVIGYQYRLDYNSAERFIQKIQELKKQALSQNPKYIDEDLGIAVIPASEMQRIVNSFFVFIPSITGFHTREYQVEVKYNEKGKIRVKFVTEYEAVVSVSIKIITAEGKLLSTYNASQKATSQSNPMEAYQSAINSAISGVSFHLRNVEDFKIKTQILKVEGGDVYIELGQNRGIFPGHEYFIQQETKFMDKFTTKTTTGLIRVREVNQEYSIATVIQGYPTVGDQLVEAPMGGGRFNIWAGMMPMKIDANKLEIIYISPSMSFTSTESFNRSSYAFAAGISLELELGYAFLFDTKIGIYINNPLAVNFDAGFGYELYFGQLSTVIGLDFSAVGISKYLGVYQVDWWNNVKVKNTTFSDDINVSLNGGTLGIKPNISINFQPSQRFKIRAFGGYALYFAPYYQLYFEQKGTSGDDKVSETVDINDANVFFLVDGKTQKTIPMDFSGLYGGIEVIFRF
ncbi:MAG: hypothetical protein N2258_00575 [Brevinematales bacterium]|nr:hypothetical protein [Brevinematales bacterium]